MIDNRKVETASRPLAVNSETKRVIKALEWVKKPFSFDVMHLDENTLEKIAKKTNSAAIHCSANCTLLAYTLLYNLKIGRTELSAKNAFPLYQPLFYSDVGQIILGDPYKLEPALLTAALSVAELKESILSATKNNGERVFFVGINNQPFGHALNAVVLGQDENLRVVFVDAWKTRKSIYTVAELQKRYSGKFNAFLYQHSGQISQLTKDLNQFSEYKQHKISIFKKPIEKLEIPLEFSYFTLGI